MTSTGPLHVMDTNVLFNWLAHLCGAAPPPWVDSHRARHRFRAKLAAAARFCEETRHDILIPHVALIELYGVFLQKSYDLDDYENWHRKRRAALNSLEYHLTAPNPRIRCDDHPVDTELALNLCRLPIPRAVLEDQRRAAERSSGYVFVPKALDGIDAGVLAAAWQTAEREPDRPVILITDDVGLRNIVRFYSRQPGLVVAGRSVPSNLRSARA